MPSLKAPTDQGQAYEFYFPGSDTHVQVEEAHDKVFVRASRNSFSEARKMDFLRVLALEGFIGDRHSWSSASPQPGSRIHWIVDASWLKTPEFVRQRTNRFMLSLLAGASILWLALITAAFLHRL